MQLKTLLFLNEPLKTFKRWTFNDGALCNCEQKRVYAQITQNTSRAVKNSPYCLARLVSVILDCFSFTCRNLFYEGLLRVKTLTLGGEVWGSIMTFSIIFFFCFLCRKMEQLILYVKALKALNLSLLFAQAEIRQGHLKPSNAVKNGKLWVPQDKRITFISCGILSNTSGIFALLPSPVSDVACSALGKQNDQANGLCKRNLCFSCDSLNLVRLSAIFCNF